MQKQKKKKIKLTKTNMALDCGDHICFYGISVCDGDYEYENKLISTNCNQVKFLIHMLEANQVENIHIQNVVDDFVFENNLN